MSEATTLLVPMDFSGCSKHALELARGFHEHMGPCHLLLVHAYHYPLEYEALAGWGDLMQRAEADAVRQLDGVLAELQDAGISSEYYTVQGRPEQVIVDLTRSKGADLIVMGTHGWSGLAHYALGSVAERVVRGAPCPVLTAREPEAA